MGRFCRGLGITAVWVGCAALSTGCPTVSRTTGAATSSSSSGTAVSLPGGAMAAKVYFQAPGGSFADPTLNGFPTGTSVGVTGYKASVLYLPNTSKTVLANGTSDINWPAWLTSVEVGLSGASNASASDPRCAHFTNQGGTTENATCVINGQNLPCSSTASLYRVSEYNCTTATTGNGSANDGVYIRVTFNRANLGATENIMAVLEFGASGLHRSPGTPSPCFNGSNNLDTTGAGCSDMTWRIYLKNNLGDLPSGIPPQPFFLLAPPLLDYANTTVGQEAVGGRVMAKQIFLPLASNSSLSVMQISRISAPGATDVRVPTMGLTCAHNSPLCLGMVFYSLTLYRM